MQKNLSFLFILPMVLCTSCNGRNKTYTVTWKNYDGTVLEVDEKVMQGEMPHYDGEEPQREKEGEFFYLFNGWDNELKAVTSDITYTATFVQGDFKVNITSITPMLEPQRKSFLFNRNDFKTVEIPFTSTDELYTIGAVKTKVENVADFEIDYENKNLKVTPLKNESFEIYVDAKLMTYTVTFHADSNCVIEDHEGEGTVTLTQTKNTLWKNIKLKATATHFDFVGWSLDSRSYGKPINDNYQLTSNIDVYPSYNISVTLNTKNEYDIGYYKIINENIVFIIKIIHPDKYEFVDKCDVKVKIGGTEYTSHAIDYNNKTITFPINDIVDNISITINPYQPTYSINSPQKLEQDNIECTFDSKNLPKKGEDYIFDLETSGKVESGDTYYLPDSLNIKIGETSIMDKGYKIVPVTGQDRNKKAKVTIYGEYINGDIVVNAAPKVTNNYIYNFHNYGCYETESESPRSVLYNTGIHEANSEFKFKITPKTEEGEEVLSVGAENIVVSLDGGSYITVEEEEGSENPRFTLKDEIFTLKADQANDKFDMYVRNPNSYYEFLNDLSWSEISDISDAGVAKYLMYIGDTKTVQIDGYDKTQQVRVIGFDHDSLSEVEGKQAGITFEFENLISNSDGAPIQDYYESGDGSCKHFTETYYQRELNKFFNNISADLQNKIKLVDKKSYLMEKGSSVKTYRTKLFPLGGSEIMHDFESQYDQNDGDLYEFYSKDKSLNARIKSALDEKNYTYWIRTPNNDWSNANHAFFVNEEGKVDSRLNWYKNFAYMAAFCV